MGRIVRERTVPKPFHFIYTKTRAVAQIEIIEDASRLRIRRLHSSLTLFTYRKNERKSCKADPGVRPERTEKMAHSCAFY